MKTTVEVKQQDHRIETGLRTWSVSKDISSIANLAPLRRWYRSGTGAHPMPSGRYNYSSTYYDRSTFHISCSTPMGISIMPFATGPGQLRLHQQPSHFHRLTGEVATRMPDFTIWRAQICRLESLAFRVDTVLGSRCSGEWQD